MGSPGGVSGGLMCTGERGDPGQAGVHQELGRWGHHGADEHRGGGGRCRSRESSPSWGAQDVLGQGCGVCWRGLPASRDGLGCRGGPGAAQGLTAPPGSWVELRCGPGCPEPEAVPSPFSCHADVERMLLEAQLETESSDGALLVLGSPAWDDNGTSHGSDQPGESEVLPAHSQPQPSCPHPRQRDVPQEAKWRQRRLRASLGWACTRCPRYLSPDQCCGACREVQWGGRRDFSVQSCCCSSSPRSCSATC
ncbi:uncharacterized protein LOC108963282 isoform X2 [Serinus canaria]|uniref:uncharacterized protein LOC108963282 isoform X2 n=1 Tax=Serinus canaria TaxID=9135 RepID=UPI0021CCCDCF|nr:uncharacterized protein LOC108963282 isoform X2 [Serinus canaria]